jgi:hypothetical protein
MHTILEGSVGSPKYKWRYAVLAWSDMDVSFPEAYLIGGH